MDIYENLHWHFTLRFFLSLFRWERKIQSKNRGRGKGRGQLNEELIDIQKLSHQNYMNSQIILAAVKWTNSEKQVRDGGRRNEERRIVLIDTDQT